MILFSGGTVANVAAKNWHIAIPKVWSIHVHVYAAKNSLYRHSVNVKRNNEPHNSTSIDFFLCSVYVTLSLLDGSRSARCLAVRQHFEGGGVPFNWVGVLYHTHSLQYAVDNAIDYQPQPHLPQLDFVWWGMQRNLSTSHLYSIGHFYPKTPTKWYDVGVNKCDTDRFPHIVVYTFQVAIRCAHYHALLYNENQQFPRSHNVLSCDQRKTRFLIGGNWELHYVFLMRMLHRIT